MSVQLVAECSFCPATLEVTVGGDLTVDDFRAITADLDALEPGWRSLFSGVRNRIVICARCAPLLQSLVDSIDQALTIALHTREPAA